MSLPEDKLDIETLKNNLEERFQKLMTFYDLSIEFEIDFTEFQRGKLEGQKKMLLELLKGIKERRTRRCTKKE